MWSYVRCSVKSFVSLIQQKCRGKSHSNLSFNTRSAFQVMATLSPVVMTLGPEHDVDALLLLGSVQMQKAHCQTNMKMDIKETPNTYQFEIDLPGVGKKDISLTLKNNVLSVEVERQIEKASGHHFMKMERYSGRIVRHIQLPSDVMESQVKSELVNGVLYVTVPKAEKNERSNGNGGDGNIVHVEESLSTN